MTNIKPILFRDKKNVAPLPYRNVSNQPYDGEMSEEKILLHLMGREAYRRTEFIILHNDSEERAVCAVLTEDKIPLFSPIVHTEVLALPDSCSYIHDPETDCANPSALADLAYRKEIGPNGTLVVQGMYDHYNFIHNPDPLVIRVVEVAPPEPPKLYGLVKHVLSYADLPPIRVELERIEIFELCQGESPNSYLVPCRSGGLEDLNAPVHYLDERPHKRQDWTLIGCERSLQFHRHYYGDEPPTIEMCPRKIAGARKELTLLKCCLLEFHQEREENVLTVPWGSDLKMVETALQDLAKEVEHV
jgi:hypothetical protein